MRKGETLQLSTPEAYRRRKDNAGKSRYGESVIYDKMKAAGIKFKWTGNTTKKGTPDFITESGKYIDVKISASKTKPNKQYIWRFNLRHHGKLQNNIDVFVLFIKEKDLIFVIPADSIALNTWNGKLKHTFSISERQLKKGIYNHFVENWLMLEL